MPKNNISTNIIRDENAHLDYIVTPNALGIFERIASNYDSGIRSFTVSGNYGTGKSSFLWAAEKNLKNQEVFFLDLKSHFNGVKAFRVLKVVGKHDSLRNSFCELLKTKSNDDSAIFESLNVLAQKQKKKGEGLAIFIDEFGKFLEYASINNPHDELFFLQTLAEWVNDTALEVLFVNTIHQNYSAYAKGLNKEQKDEWAKISGRFKVLSFNEPIEQLLYFTSERLGDFSISESLVERGSLLNKTILESKLVSSIKKEGKVNYSSLYPLDALAAQILIKSLDLYGQNERSLFTFLDSNDRYGIRNFQGDFFDVGFVFDYLVNTVTNEIASNENPKKTQWKALQATLDKIELHFDNDEFVIAEQIIKLIGLVNMFGAEAGVLNDEFIINYILATRGLKAEKVLQAILDHKLIQFFRHKTKYNFVDGTDLDIPQELALITKEVNPNFKVHDFLQSEIELPILLAKRHSHETGTPRFFCFHYCDDLDGLPPVKGEEDGFIHLTFDKDFTKKRLKEVSGEIKEARIFVYYNNTDQIRSLVFDLQRYKLLIEKFRDDRIARKILEDEWSFLRIELEKCVLRDLYTDHRNVSWFYGGKEIEIQSSFHLNQTISNICLEVYSKAPVFRSELANREILSTPINTSRRKLIGYFLDNGDKPNLDFPQDKFPPEKAIYLSLARNTGIHGPAKESEFVFGFHEPTEESFLPVWRACMAFLEASKQAKQNVAKLYKELGARPFKMKKGFLDFWIPLFLIANKEDFALFHADNGYVPYLTQNVLDLIHKAPEKYFIRTYDVEGVNSKILDSYNSLLQVNPDQRKGTGSTLISMFGSFYVFYNDLPEYTKRTNKLSAQTIAFRDAIASSSDPSSALLEALPAAFGYHSSETKVLDSFLDHLKESIRELRTAYGELLDRVEIQIVRLQRSWTF